MNSLRAIAGIFAGTAALVLIVSGMLIDQPYAVAAGTTLMGTMMGFFTGENNGKKIRPPEA